MAAKKRSRGVPSGKQLASLRARLKLTQEEMADAFNVTVAVYRNWEQGRFTPPGPVAIVYEYLQSSPPKQ